MADLVVIVPSRGRPQAVAEMAEVFGRTCTLDTRLAFVVDNDDPCLPAYHVPPKKSEDYLAVEVRVGAGDHQTMVDALNHAAAEVVVDSTFAIGFMGDDHRPRTVGWDEAYLTALRSLGTGIVYGDDLLQRANLPTQCAMTADIPGALGYMAPPGLTHMYVDNFWLDLGRAADCIRYLPDVVVEHLHPVAGKAEWDEGHRRVNAPQMYHRDQAAYSRYRTTEMTAAVAKVRALRKAAGDG